MRELDRLEVGYGGLTRTIELWEGDLTEMPPEEHVDLLVVSAFPDDYQPLDGNLIGALAQKGVVVGKLAQDKAEDLRANFGCWLSKPLLGAEAVGAKRILCFEPHTRGRPPEVVGEIFRSLAPFVMGPDPTVSV